MIRRMKLKMRRPAHSFLKSLRRPWPCLSQPSPIFVGDGDMLKKRERDGSQWLFSVKGEEIKLGGSLSIIRGTSLHSYGHTMRCTGRVIIYIIIIMIFCYSPVQRKLHLVV